MRTLVMTRKKITSSLLNLGFNELIHYSLVNETTFLDNEIKLIILYYQIVQIYVQVYYQV
jgi:hypothetical protein